MVQRIERSQDYLRRNISGAVWSSVFPFQRRNRLFGLLYPCGGGVRWILFQPGLALDLAADGGGLDRPE